MNTIYLKKSKKNEVNLEAVIGIRGRQSFDFLQKVPKKDEANLETELAIRE